MDDTSIMTIDQLLLSDIADGRVELVAGVVHRMTPAGGQHGLLCSNTLFALLKHVRAHKLGGVFTPDTGFVLRRGPDTLRCPDVACDATATASVKLVSERRCRVSTAWGPIRRLTTPARIRPQNQPGNACNRIAGHRSRSW